MSEQSYLILIALRNILKTIAAQRWMLTKLYKAPYNLNEELSNFYCSQKKKGQGSQYIEFYKVVPQYQMNYHKLILYWWILRNLNYYYCTFNDINLTQYMNFLIHLMKQNHIIGILQPKELLCTIIWWSKVVKLIFQQCSWIVDTIKLHFITYVVILYI